MGGARLSGQEGGRGQGMGGSWVITTGRAAAAGRPEARSAEGRPGCGFRRGSPSTPSRNGGSGLGGITPDKILQFYVTKDAFSCNLNELDGPCTSTENSTLCWPQLLMAICTNHFKNKFINLRYRVFDDTLKNLSN